MARKKNEKNLPAVQENNLPSNTDVPDFLSEYAGEGTRRMGDYEQLSRIKLCHPTSRMETQELFDMGEMFLSPDEVSLCEFGDSIDVIPIFFYPSFAVWRDNDDPEAQTNPVVTEVMDEASEVAKRARSKADRRDPYPDNPDWAFEYVEHLNFLVRIDSPGEAYGKIALVEFSRGNAALGRRLCGYYGRLPVPIWGCRIELFAGKAANNQKQVYHRIEWRVARPQFITKDQTGELKKLHEQVSEAYNARLLSGADR